MTNSTAEKMRAKNQVKTRKWKESEIKWRTEVTTWQNKS